MVLVCFSDTFLTIELLPGTINSNTSKSSWANITSIKINEIWCQKLHHRKIKSCIINCGRHFLITDGVNRQNVGRGPHKDYLDKVWFLFHLVVLKKKIFFFFFKDFRLSKTLVIILDVRQNHQTQLQGVSHPDLVQFGQVGLKKMDDKWWKAH